MAININENILSNLSDILSLRGWQKLSLENNRHFIYMPPQNLGFEDDYKLYIPKKTETFDFESNIYKSLEILTQVYSDDIDELVSIVIENKEIFSLHIEDETALNGKIPIPHFNSLLDKIKKLLQEAASFTVLNKPHILDKIEETERYLNQCKFLKNKSGSIITKIELPKNEEIKEKTLFEPSIIGSVINKKALDVISFVNKSLLMNEYVQPDEEFLLLNKDLINVNLIDAVKDLYTETDLVDIDIELKGTNIEEKTFAKDLTKQKIDSLKLFTKTVREKINEIIDLELFGKVVQLSSKDVESDKNTIKVEAMIKNVKSTISVTLTANDYKNAIYAHEHNKTVKIVGVFDKEKTQFKVVELKSFKMV